jgi:hypothetical protein
VTPSSTWDETISELQTMDHAFVAPLAALLDASKTRWEPRVSASRRLLMHPPGMGVGFRDIELSQQRKAPEVFVSWTEGVYEMRLNSEAGLLVTADRCREENAEAVLDAFLLQLVGDPK